MSDQSPDDVIVVMNIDIDCTQIVRDSKTEIVTTKDPETGYPYRQYNETTIEFDHSKGFAVLYDGRTFNIAPGATRRLPRYIAEHYAKHLIDHILTKKDPKGTLNLINNQAERDVLKAQIFIEEDYLYDEISSTTSSVKTKINSKEDDYLELPEDEDDEPTKEDITEVVNDEVIDRQPNENINIGEKQFSRQQLMKDCKQLGIKFSIKETTQDLADKIKKFSGV